MRTMNCDRTFTGEHLYNPRSISEFGNGRGPYVFEYRCICGQYAKDKKVVEAQLKETRMEQKQQIEEVKRVTGAKRMTKQNATPLPGFEEYV
jgi:hypothetical protein